MGHIWKQVNYRLNHIWIYGPDYGQPGAINISGQVYDQPGCNLFLLWQSMINLFLHDRENREIYYLTWVLGMH